MPDGVGGKLIQKDRGWGDLNLGVPLKKYFNLDGKSGSWTFKPMVRIPLSNKDDYDFYYKEFGGGIGFGHEFETANYFFGIGTAWWIFDGDRPAEIHSSLDFGYNFETKNSNGSVFWETDFHAEDDESRTLGSGPAFYFNHNDTIHSRIEWKHDFIDHQGIIDHGNGKPLQDRWLRFERKRSSSSPSLVLRLELSRSSALPFRVNAESSVRCGFSLSPKIHQANSC